MTIEWSKVIEKPEAKVKVDGSYLLDQREKIANLEAQVEELTRKIEETSNQLVKSKEVLETTIEMHSNISKELKGQLTEKESEINGLSSNLDSSNDEAQKLQDELNTANQTIQDLNVKISDLENEVQDKSNQINEIEVKIEASTAAHDDLKQKFEEVNQQINTITKEKDEQIAKLEADLANASTEISKTKENSEAEIDELNNKISSLNEQISSIQEEKNKEIEALKGSIEEEKAKAVEQLKADNQKELNDLKADQQKELDDLKASHEEELNGLKSKIEGLTPKEVETPVAEPVTGVASYVKKATQETKEILLRFDGKIFVEEASLNESDINLFLNINEQRWQLSWGPDSSLIDRKTAERQARSIAKTGYKKENQRFGASLELELIGQQKIPEALTRDQHEYMRD